MQTKSNIKTKEKGNEMSWAWSFDESRITLDDEIEQCVLVDIRFYNQMKKLTKKEKVEVLTNWIKKYISK